MFTEISGTVNDMCCFCKSDLKKICVIKKLLFYEHKGKIKIETSSGDYLYQTVIFFNFMLNHVFNNNYVTLSKLLRSAF